MNKITIGNKTQYAWPPPRPGYEARVPPHSSQISQWLQLIPLWLLISERSYLAIFVTAQCTTYSFLQCQWLQDCLSLGDHWALSIDTYVHIAMRSQCKRYNLTEMVTLQNLERTQLSLEMYLLSHMTIM